MHGTLRPDRIATVLRMPDSPATTEGPPQRDGRRAVAYWFAAGVVYIALGVAYPPAFLLGFQESAIFVFLVTALAPVVVRRHR